MSVDKFGLGAVINGSLRAVPRAKSRVTVRRRVGVLGLRADRAGLVRSQGRDLESRTAIETTIRKVEFAAWGNSGAVCLDIVNDKLSQGGMFTARKPLINNL